MLSYYWILTLTKIFIYRTFFLFYHHHRYWYHEPDYFKYQYKYCCSLYSKLIVSFINHFYYFTIFVFCYWQILLSFLLFAPLSLLIYLKIIIFLSIISTSFFILTNIFNVFITSVGIFNINTANVTRNTIFVNIVLFVLKCQRSHHH